LLFDIALNMGKIAAADKMRMQMLRERLTACVAVNIVVTLGICANSVHLQVCIRISAPKNGSFWSHPHTTEENKIRNDKTKNYFFPRQCSSSM